MKSSARFWLTLLFSAAVFLVLVCGGGVLFLRSAAGSRFLLEQARSTLSQSQNIQLEYSHGRLDPFSSLEFKDLKLTGPLAQGRWEVVLPEFELRFGFSLWNRALVIERLRLENPSVLVQGKGQGGGVKSASAQGKPLDLANPPVSVLIRELQLNGLKLDVEYEDPAIGLKSRFDGTYAGFKMDWSRGKLALAGSLDIGKGTERPGGEVSISYQGPQGRTALQVRPSGILRFDAEWGTQALAHPLEAVSALKWLGELHSGPGLLELAAGRRIRFEDHSLKLESSSAATEPGLRIRYDARRLRSETEMDRPVDLSAVASLSWEKNGSLLLAKGSGEWNGNRLFQLETEFRPEGEKPALNGRLEFLGDERLAALAKPLQSLKRVGGLNADLAIEVVLADSLEALAGLSPAKWGFAGKAEGKFIQKASRPGPQLSFDPATLASDFAREGGGLRFSARLDSARVESYGKRLPKVLLEAEGAYRPDGKIGVNAILKSGAEEVARAESLTEFPVTGPAAGGISAKGSLRATSGAYLENFAPRAQLAKLGDWELEGRWEAGMTAAGRMRASADGTLTQKGELSVDSLVVYEPLRFQAKGEMEGLGLSGSGVVELPAFHSPGKVRAGKTRMNASFDSRDWASRRDFGVNIKVEQDELTLEPALAHGHEFPMKGLAFELAASLRGGDRFTLERLKGELNRGMLQFTGEGTGRLEKREFQLQGLLEAKFPKDLPELFGQKVVGKIALPWTLSLLDGRNIHVEGDAEITDFSWAKAPLRINGMSGRLSVSEDLVWNGKNLSFSTLITQNPFERVDYERFRPLLDGESPLTIQSLGFEEKAYGPLHGYFSVRQNMVFANQVMLRLGSGGQLTGAMAFNAHPANLTVGFLSRITGLNLQEVLPRKYLAHANAAEGNLSGRSNLVINLNRGSIDGRVDVTEIGASQLITLINAMDPKFENEQMNKARFALGVAYPKVVEMAFQQGFMDMGVELGGALSTRLALKGIPLATWVTAATADIVKKTEGGPLK